MIRAESGHETLFLVRIRQAGHGAIPGVDLPALGFFLREPGTGHVFGFGVKSETVFAHDMQIPEKGILVSGKSEDAHRHRDAHIDPHHACIGSFGEFPGVIDDAAGGALKLAVPQHQGMILGLTACTLLPFAAAVA